MNQYKINSLRVYKNLNAAGMETEQAEAVAMTFHQLNESLIDKMSDMLDVKFAAVDAMLDAKFAGQDAMLDAKFAGQDAMLDAKFAGLATKTELYLGLIAMAALLVAVVQLV